MSKKSEAHSSVLTALRFAERVLMNETDLSGERCHQVISDIESIYGALTQLWEDEFELVPTHVGGGDQPNKLKKRVS